MTHISDVSLREVNDLLSDIGNQEGSREIKKILKVHPTKADLNVEEES